MKNILKIIWKNREQIFEGIKNSIIRDETVEEISRLRYDICDECPRKGKKCAVKGRFSSTDFLAKDDELYYRLVGKQTLPINCRTGIIYLTNVQDIVLFVNQGTFQHQMARIKPEEVLTGAEITSLALFVWYKWREAERKKMEMGWEVACKAKTRKPGDSPPHHIGNGVCIFCRGDVVYENVCQNVVVHQKDTAECFRDYLIETSEGKTFYSPRTGCQWQIPLKKYVCHISPGW